MGFEPTILASKRAKTVYYALDHSATVTGVRDIRVQQIQHGDNIHIINFHLRSLTC
jgi:hypothetical protein